MSGHSHWAGIKHKKGIADAKRAKVFTKIARVITVAAREKGGDPAANASLRMAIEKARAANMPADNIERAMKRGTGDIEGGKLEGFLYEAYGPGGVALLIEGITDNKQRTLPEIKKVLAEHGGRFAEQGSVLWMFERKGFLSVPFEEGAQKEGLELKIIDAGAEDVRERGEAFGVYTAPEKLMETKKRLEEADIQVASAGFDYVEKTPATSLDEGSKKKLENLFEALDEHDDVQEIYSNAQL